MGLIDVPGWEDVTDPKQLPTAPTAALKAAEARCYNDIAQAIRRNFPGIKITGPMVAERVNALMRMEETLRRSDCETCYISVSCHKHTGVVRINCPMWRPNKQRRPAHGMREMW